MDLETALAKALQEVPRGEITSGFVSKHFGPGNFNENNVGLGYRSPDGWMGGAYRNSLNKNSVYAGKEFLGDLFGPVKGGVMLGGVTGYGKPVMPLALPTMVVQGDDRSVAGTFVPPIKGVTPATFALQLRRKF